MKTQLSLLGLLTLVSKSYSHWTNPYFIVNGTAAPAWKYVRDVKGVEGQGENGKIYPLFNLSSPDMICGRDIGAASKTSTATVIAGDEVGFKPSSVITTVEGIFVHEGPGLAYLSRAPNDDVEHYDGRGDWFKIAYLGPSSDTTWKLFEKNAVKFNIPKTTPPGKYLLRIEHIYPLSRPDETQFYISCAHINVVGPGGGKPSNFIRFPGAYSPNDPGVLVTDELYHNRNLLNYKPPGPPVWQG